MKHYAGIDGSLEYASAAQSQADLPGDEGPWPAARSARVSRPLAIRGFCWRSPRRHSCRHTTLYALDVAFDVCVGLNVEPNVCSADEERPIVFHDVVRAIDDSGNRLHEAYADIRVVRVGIFAVENLVWLEFVDFAVDGEFVVVDLVGKLLLSSFTRTRPGLSG
jgi:hypothetical protein